MYRKDHNNLMPSRPLFTFQDFLSSRRAKRAGWPKGLKGQPACFGAGCYIEMATSYHQPHEYELVGG